MRKTKGNGRFFWSVKAMERHSSGESPREGPSERLLWGMASAESFLLIDKMQTKD